MPPRAAVLALLVLPLASATALAQWGERWSPPGTDEGAYGGSHQPGLPDPSFTLLNNTPQPVERLFVSPVGSGDWGHDRLGSRALPPERSQHVRLDPRDGCRQDLRAVFGDGGMQDLRGLDTCAVREVRLGPPAAPPEPRLALRNAGRQPIVAAYASPAGLPDWGMDRLTVHPLPPGDTFRLDLPPGACEYDVKVLYADGATGERRGLDLCARPAVRFP